MGLPLGEKIQTRASWVILVGRLTEYLPHHTKKYLIRTLELLSLLFLLSGCQAVLTPDQVTTEFWVAMAEGNLDSARKYATRETKHLVTKQQNLEDATVKTG